MISLSAITFLLMTDGTDLQTACLSAWRTVRVDLRIRCRRAVRVKLPLCHLAISSLVVLPDEKWWSYLVGLYLGDLWLRVGVRLRGDDEEKEGHHLRQQI